MCEARGHWLSGPLRGKAVPARISHPPSMDSLAPPSPLLTCQANHSPSSSLAGT
uniref:Uncharacterized protein n=1 Tax=Thermogemmatispora argillosa TaxID=2045280 RepID=A0A455T4E3_9CHLR|nr:hypothetical protein KTA_15440 [Thermogemmatispora argillosa]